MKLKIEGENLEVYLLVSPEGGYLPSKEPLEVEKVLSFEHPFLGKFSVGASPEGETNFGLLKFVEIAKGLLYAERGLLFESYKAVKNFLNFDWLNLLGETFGETTLKNFLLEATLGAFEPDGFVEKEFDTEKLAKEFFSLSGVNFYTRVVGFGYRRETFEDEKGNLTLKVGEKVFALWEKENEYDPNAVAVYHQSGEKLGYLRKTYSEHLKGVLREKLLLEGEIVGVIERNNPNEMVYISLTL